MSWDECEYYFELADLQPFVGVPLSDLFLGTASHSPDEVAPSSPTTSSKLSAASQSPAAASTSDRVDRSAPESAASDNGCQSARPIGDEGSPSHASASGDSAAPSENQFSSELSGPESDTVLPRAAVPASRAPRSTGEAAAGNRSNASATFGQQGRSRTPSEYWQERMSVHALGQFAFCSRAGIHAAENPDETDLDELPPNWSYLPNFDLERIEEQLADQLRLLLLLLVVNCIFVGAVVGGVWIQDRRILYVALVGMFFALNSLISTCGGVLVLSWRRAAARRAQACELGPTIDRIEPVNWWSLLKAGFDQVAHQRQFRHPELPLEGSPWRVLERGSLRIPVIKSGGARIGDARYMIYPKHELRLAAYAMLLEATEHVQVPYGLVFPADSHQGLAVPITPSLRAQVVEQLEKAGDLLARSQRGESEPRPPVERKRCATCRLGEPLPISEGEIAAARKSRARLVVLKDTHEHKYHCACGDRFGSAPPHGRIIKLGLSSTVE